MSRSLSALLLDLEQFSCGRGALQVSLAMSCHVYPDIMLGVYSKATTCMRASDHVHCKS
jgi:hypothetical protein